MKRYQKILMSMALTLGIAVAGFLPAAHATAMLKLDAGGPVTILTDGDMPPSPVTDMNPASGQVKFLGAISPFLIDSTGVVLGTLSHPGLDLVALTLSSGPGVLTLEFTETGFTAPGPIGYGIAIGGTAGFKVNSFEAYRDASNAAFGKAEPLASTGGYGPGAFSGSETSGSITPMGGPYSLTIVLEVEHNANGQVTTFNATLLPQPEPGTLLLFGTGLLGMFGYGWRRRKQAA